MKKKELINWSIIAVSALVLIGYVLFVNGIDNFLSTIVKVNPWWMCAAAFCMLLYWLLESQCLHLVAKKLHPKQRFRSSLKTSMIGQLFNCITPFASGGQPVQAYHMIKNGMTLGSASAALLAKFIIYQFALTLYSAVVLLFKFSFFQAHISGFSLLLLLGFVINVAVVLGLIAVGFFPNLTRRFLLFCVLILHKLHILKSTEKIQAAILAELSQFHEDFKQMKGSGMTLLRMFFLSILQLTVYFFIPYLIGLAMGIRDNDLFTMLAGNACVLMITSFVPLPGAAGGAEGSFLMFFHMFFNGSSELNMAVLLWRLLTFYFPILVGLMFAHGDHGKVVADIAQEPVEQTDL